jgi:hypothetical protein
MKQRITFSQLNELNDVQKERLRGFWIPVKKETIVDNHGHEYVYEFHFNVKKTTYPYCP